MDLSIAGPAGPGVFASIIVEVLRRFLGRNDDDRWTPVATLLLATAAGVLFYVAGWLAVPNASVAVAAYLGAALIGFWSGAATEGLTNAWSKNATKAAA